MKLDLEAVQWDFKGIDRLLDQIILNADGDIAGDIARNQAGNRAVYSQDIDSQNVNIEDILGSNKAGTVARGIAENKKGYHRDVFLSSQGKKF